MPLSALVGQPRAASMLGGALVSGRVHHAYLFAGPPGVGKTLAAKLLAQALNCESDAAQAAAARGVFLDEPCGKCLSCKRISDVPKAHAHPLVMWVDTEARMEAAGLYSPEGDRTASKAIGVRLLRELVIPRLMLRVMGGRRKVVIVQDVDITEGAQNAILKTLEEPPPDTTFMVLSSTPEGLKPTIRSRCLRVTFAPLAPELVAERVARENKLTPELARLSAAIAGGNLGLALKVDPKSLEKRRQLIVTLERLAPDDWAGWLSLAESLGTREDALEALDVLEAWLHDVVLAASAGVAPATNLDLATEAADAAARLGAVEVLRRVELVRLGRTSIEGNAQPRLALEKMLLAFNGIFPLSLVQE